MDKKEKIKKSGEKAAYINYKQWIAPGIIIFFVAVIRIRLLGVPLERDEGEYAYMGQLILQGIPPYKIAYNMKFPGTYYMYALFMSIFGQTISGIHIGLLIVNLTSILLLFLLVKKLVSNYAAVAAISCFALLSLSLPVFGFAGHATHFVILFALSGMLILVKALTENKSLYYFWAGLLLGLAPVMKQQGVFFPICGGLFLLIIAYVKRKAGFRVHLSRFFYYTLGGVIPLLIIYFLLKISGVFDRFWFWTIKYAFEYEDRVLLKDAFTNFKVTFIPFWESFYPIWIITSLGLGALFIHPKLKKNFSILFLLLFTIFSFISICPGLIFREHYFVTFLPAMAILFGILIDYLREVNRIFNKTISLKYASYGIFIVAILSGFINQFDYFFQLSPGEICKAAYRYNPFIESIEISKYIQTNSKIGDKIAVLGSEPEIYFYSGRHSASGYIYTYSLMENQRDNLAMQKEMIGEIENSMPEFIVYVNLPKSWLMHPNSNKYIFNWMGPFLDNNHYQLKGIGDVLRDETIFKWGSEVNNYQLRSEYFILILRKKG